MASISFDTPCDIKYNEFMSYEKHDMATRFWEKVHKTDSCWVWESAIFKQTGYGAFSINNKPYNAHRVSWELTNGIIPTGSYILHHCDNRRCVNPSHLFIGTQKQNIEDCRQKGRLGNKSRPGEINGSARLTANDVAFIKLQLLHYQHGMSRKLARQFGISDTAIHSIKSGKTWA